MYFQVSTNACLSDLAVPYVRALKNTGTLRLDLEPVATMATLAMCHGAITSFGTYGWWSAWLAGGPVTYSNHLNEANDPSCGVAYKSGGVRDLYPPEWMPV